MHMVWAGHVWGLVTCVGLVTVTKILNSIETFVNQHCLPWLSGVLLTQVFGAQPVYFSATREEAAVTQDAVTLWFDLHNCSNGLKIQPLVPVCVQVN